MASRQGLAEGTVKKYELVTRLFSEFVGELHLLEVTLAHVSEFLQDRDLTLTSKHVYRRHLSVFFNWCVDQGWMLLNLFTVKPTCWLSSTWNAYTRLDGPLAQAPLENSRCAAGSVLRSECRTLASFCKGASFTTIRIASTRATGGSRRFCWKMGCRVSYSGNGAKRNPWIESLWGRLKVEIGSRIFEASCLPELRELLKGRFRYYNEERRHSTIGNKPPRQNLTETIDTPDFEERILATS